MHEKVLCSYFAGDIGPDDLSRDLVGSMVPGSAPGMVPEVVRHPIVNMDQEFQIRVEHLVKLCDDVITGNIPPEYLEPIGFCLVTSDHFDRLEEAPDSERIWETINDWAAPQINYQLTTTTAQKFRHRLLTGESLFGPGDYFSDRPHGAA